MAGKSLVILVVCIVELSLVAPRTYAQGNSSNRRPGREFVEGVLNTLIESQLPSSSQRTAQPSSRRATNVNMRDVQTNLASFSQELSNLVAEIHGSAHVNYGFRAILSDALQTNATATLLTRRAANETNLRNLEAGYQQLDQEWRSLAFKLEQIRNLNARTTDYIRRCNELNQRLGNLFQTRPQVNARELQRNLNDLSSELMHLQDDLEIEVDNRNLRYELQMEGRRLLAIVRRISSMMLDQNTTPSSVRTEYQAFQRQWDPYLRRLREVNSRYVARQVQRIQAADRQIQELLWMTPGVDRTEIIYLSKQVQTDVEALMNSISLRQLTRLDTDPSRTVRLASSLSGYCDDFVTCVQNGDSDQTLASIFNFLDDEWKGLSSDIQRIDSREARQYDRLISNSLGQLRQILRAAPQMDLERVVQSAAALENYADQFQVLVGQVLNENNRYTREFRNEITNNANRFRQSVEQLHADLHRNVDRRTLQQHATDVVTYWEGMNNQIARFPLETRNRFYDLRNRSTPLVVDVQTMLTL
ncbi:MAG: hypothetical protein KDA87_20305 [Planctomycetales bacterium]|nr:hypothetical protein [Planctomycetales bacterium]